jgi:thiol-disulfide isomerase/thioredoxin
MFIDVRNPAQSSVSNTSYHLDKGVSISSGDGASVNNYLFEASLSLQGSEIVEAAKHRSLEDYHSFLDSMQQARIALKKETIYDARIEEYLFGEIVASTFYHKSMYLAYSRKSENTAMQANDPARDKFWKEWGFLSDEALISAGYREGLTAYFNKKASLKEGPVTDDRTREKFFAAAFTSATSELMDRPNTREYMTAFFLYHMLTFVERADSAVVLASRFYETFPESVYYPAIEKKLQLKRKISHVAPDIYGVDTTSRSIRIADLKGKVLYIDVWASWCGPCIQEFRNSKKLADKFKDREVCFVYLNIDDTDQAWRRMIGVKKIEGIHIRADKAAANEIKKNYGISSIPRYILIDKEGNLVSASAKRPSDVESDISRLLDTK